MLNEGDLALPDPSHCNWSQQLFFTTFLGPRRSYSSIITTRKTTSYQHFTLVNIWLCDSGISSPAVNTMLKKGLGYTDTEILHQTKTQPVWEGQGTRQGQCFPQAAVTTGLANQHCRGVLDLQDTREFQFASADGCLGRSEIRDQPG